MKIYLQNNEQDCLLACYAMVLHNMGSKISLSDLYLNESIPSDGLSVSYLNNLNSQYKLDMKVYRCKLRADNIYKTLHYFKLPCILQWDFNHFVLLTKVSKNKIYIIDPAIGKIKLSINEFLKHFSSIIITFNRKETFYKIKSHNAFNKYLLNIFSDKNSFFYILALFIFQIVSIGISILLQNVINKRFSNYVSIVVFLCIVLGCIISTVIKTNAQRNSNLKYEKIVTKKMFKNILQQPLLFFNNNSAGSIVEKINLKNAIKDSVIHSIIPSLINILSVILLIFYLYSVSKILSLCLFILTTVYLVITLAIYKELSYRNVSYIQSMIENSSLIQKGIDNIEYIKANHYEDKELKDWLETSQMENNKYLSLLIINEYSALLSQLFNYIGLFLIIFIGMKLMEKNMLNIGNLVLFQTGISLFTAAVGQLQSMFLEFSKVNNSSEKIEYLFKDTKNIEDYIKESDSFFIKLDHLSYSYPLSKKLFNNISFEIKKGEKVIILGNSGSGKSTLFNIMLNLYTEYEGDLVYGDAEFRDNLGIVTQNMIPKEGTIYQNIIMDKEFDNDELEQVLLNTNSMEIVNSLPKGIMSKLFSGGKNLSGGQIQRLLIAKSLYKTDYVFWDEVFSNLDIISRNTIYENILNSDTYSDKTMIIINHHLDVIKYVDSVIFIDDKHQVFKDTPENLYKNNNQFKQLMKVGQNK